MHSADDLNARFAILNHLSFEETSTGLTRILVNTPHATATLYTHGAHLAEWQPRGQQPVLYLSERSEYKADRVIRGGVPVIFPWFGPRWNGGPGGSHGFARTAEWSIASTHLSPDGEVHIVFSLGPNNRTCELGFDHFQAQYTVVIGEQLMMALTVKNEGAEPLTYEDAMHTYFTVGDVHKVEVEGLGGAKYLDKRDEGKEKTQTEAMLLFTRDEDRVYDSNTAALALHDAAWKRTVHMEKSGSNTTVCWNPWSVLTPDLPDMAPDDWQRFVCVEAVNAFDSRITLAPGASHTTECTLRVESRT